MNAAAKKTLTVVQVASPIGRQKVQRATLIGLGLNKINRSRELERYAIGAWDDRQGESFGARGRAFLRRRTLVKATKVRNMRLNEIRDNPGGDKKPQAGRPRHRLGNRQDLRARPERPKIAKRWFGEAGLRRRSNAAVSAPSETWLQESNAEGICRDQPEHSAAGGRRR